MSTLENLRQQLGKQKPRITQNAFSTGCAELDRLLPHGGLRRGCVMEWVGSKSLCEAALISLLVMQQAMADAQTLLLIDPTQSLYAPTLVSMGLDLDRVLYVTPRSKRDVLWACDQGLRCPAVGVVFCLQPEGDATTFRRFQIAAEDHGTIGCFVFDQRRQPHRCWGDVRLGVESLPRGDDDAMSLRVDVQRSTRGHVGDYLMLEVTSQGQFHVPPVRHKKPYSLRLVSALADSATRFA